MHLIEGSRLEKLQGDTIQLRSLRYMEYQMCFILVDPQLTAGTLIQE
jgi:hypothetical protein